MSKLKSKGICPVCKYSVKRGGVRRTIRGVRRWYHNWCYNYALSLKRQK